MNAERCWEQLAATIGYSDGRPRLPREAAGERPFPASWRRSVRDGLRSSMLVSASGVLEQRLCAGVGLPTLGSPDTAARRNPASAAWMTGQLGIE